MNRGFYTIMAAQFFSSLADNALLIAAMAVLFSSHSPEWMTPLLKFTFALSYVALAAFVGAFADSRPKGKVMFATNLIKIAGCGLMFFDVHPLIAYGVVGFGAAAYSPAKYGILTELLPPEKLVAANGWIEGLTVSSIILGVLLGGKIITPDIAHYFLAFDFPLIDTGIDTVNEFALCVITSIYVLAAICNRYIPDTGARYPQQEKNPIKLLTEFTHCCVTLWKDKLGQISLSVTTLFWGAGATLQLLVLEWANVNLGMELSKGTQMQGVFAIGIAIGALYAARMVPLKRSLNVLPMGILMGVLVSLMVLIKIQWVGYIFLVIIGSLAGYFVVPMNALLQYRGHTLMSAGHSIAVQNFNENLCILVMVALYSLLKKWGVHTSYIVVGFGLFVAILIVCIKRLHESNQRQFDAVAHIGESHH